MDYHKFFYRLTAWFPRLLPTTQTEIDQLKQILVQHFGLKDDPRVWCTVLGQICSVKPTSIRKPYSHLVNVAKRLDINKLANDLKMVEIERLQVMLQEKLKEMADANVPEGAHNLEGTLQVLPPIEEAVVPLP
jgi:hypothetical protein